MNGKNNTENYISSGNTIVDKLGQMDFTGNIVNPNWNYHVTNENNKPNYLAVQILAEIVYWTRPSIAVNETGVGPSGYGGDTTCLFAFVESAPCHIASMPVAISINCHAARHKEIIL